MSNRPEDIDALGVWMLRLVLAGGFIGLGLAGQTELAYAAATGLILTFFFL